MSLIRLRAVTALLLALICCLGAAGAIAAGEDGAMNWRLAVILALLAGAVLSGWFAWRGDAPGEDVEEADLVLLMVDGRAGRTPGDEHTAERLRRYGRPVLLVVNKTEGLEPQSAVAEFHALGLGTPIPVSAAHGHGSPQRNPIQ